MSRNAEPGRLTVEGDAITFRQAERGWTVPFDSIVAIGEFTNQDGPWLDDWFVCLVTDPERPWYEAPVDAAGVREVLEWLATRLGAPMQLQLANSTDFKSRVIWPVALQGKELFEFTDPKPAGRWQRFLKLCRLWPWHNVQHVHAEVLEALGSRRARTA